MKVSTTYDKKKLDKSFILKDLYSYRNVIERLYSRSDSIAIYYPKKIKQFFEIITSANCVSKSVQIRKFVFSIFKDRKFSDLFKDFSSIFKCVMDVFFGK